MPFTFKLSQRLARMRCTALIVTAAALAACEKPMQFTDPGNAAPQLFVSPRTVTLRTNQVVGLMAVGLTATGDTVPLSVTWSVTSGSVIDTTTSGGRHYGHYKAGSDTGKVKVIARGNPGGSSDTATVTVTLVPVSAVTISPAAASVLVGQTGQLAATTLDSAGNVLTGRTVTWTSGNSSVAMVSGSGLVTAVAAGSTTVTAASEGQSGTASISVSNVPVATVTVSPATASLTVGGTQQFTATPKDANGSPLSGRTITWTSSNSGVATVSASGLASAGAAGSATIAATSEGKSGTAAVTVVNPVLAPATVTDLSVSGVTDTSVTLSFTEVNDGTGQPASYDVRYSAGTISWGSATEVSRGSCTAPVAGTAIGAKRSCTVLGLAAATAYQFQVIAFRGTLNVNAVFGSVSNVASGTTGAGAVAPVATVTVSPASASVVVGGTQQFTATLKDANGNVLSGRTISWTSSAPSVASITGSGLVSALLAGTTSVTAMSEGQSGTATVTVTALPPPPSGSWPNEPAGFTVLTDWGFDQVLPTSGDVPIVGSLGWHEVYNALPGSPRGWALLVSDPSAPFSPANVYDFVYPQGMVEGTAPATVYYPMAGSNAVFAGFWWKPSSPFDAGPNGNKIAFLWNGGGTGGGQMFMILKGDGRLHVLPEYPGDFRWRDPNVTSTPVTLGVWHRIEWYVQLSTGTLKWWLDGVLQGSYSDVSNTYLFDMIYISPTWGGNSGALKAETDHYWFDHIHISAH